MGCATSVLDVGHHRGSACVVAAVDDHGGPPCGQLNRGSPADPRRRAGDQRGFEASRERVEEAQAGIEDPDKILALFDAVAEYLSLPEYRGCPFDSAAAEAPVGKCQVMAIQEYRDWLNQSLLRLAADTGVPDTQALAEALIVLFNGALASANTGPPARAAAMTAKRLARLTLAAAKASSSD